jgi:hypothetical protein
VPSKALLQQVLLVVVQQVSPLTIGTQLVLVVMVVMVADPGPDTVTVRVVVVVILGLQVLLVVMV